MVLDNGCLHIIGNRCGKVGVINSDVGLVIAQLELIVLRLLSKILRGDLGTLNGNQHTQLVYKVCVIQTCCVLKGVGDIQGLELLNGGIQNGYGSVLNLVGSAVNILGTCNRYGHTCLDTQILCGILIHGVNVVATLVVFVHNVELVVLVALGLRVNSNNNTLNNYRVACLCGIVSIIGKNCVCGNNALKGLGCGVALCTLNGCSQNVLDFLGSLFRNVNENLANCFGGLNGNLGNVNGPLNLKSNACYQYLVNDLIVGRSVGGLGGAFVLVKVEQISGGILYGSRGGRCCGPGAFFGGSSGLFFLSACCKRRKAKSQQQQNRN